MDEDDLDEFLPRAFDVDIGESPPDGEEPLTGEEYLRRVRWVANRCPKVVVADIDMTKIKQTNTISQKPLDADTGASLRSLLRRLATLRTKIENIEDPDLAQVNVLITIVAKRKFEIYDHFSKMANRVDDRT
eukprot:gene13072-15374_t